MNSIVRPLQESELGLVLEIERACYAQPWSEDQFRQELDKPYSRVDLLWRGERLAGYLCYWLLAGEMQILNLATAPGCQRTGVARLLLTEALNRCRQQGLERAYLEVRVGNRPALGLYRSLGFVEDGCRRRYYADGEDALLMKLVSSDE